MRPMLTLLMMASVLAGGLPQLAFAQDIARASQSLELSATAPSACVVRTPQAISAANATFQANGAAGGQVTITRLVDPDTALARATTIEIAVPATCNASHRVTALSGRGGLQRIGATGVEGTGFAEFLTYSLRLGWAGVQREQASNLGLLAVAVANGATGEVALRVATVAGGTPLIAGQYDDSIVIQLQPAD
ncbi:MAG: hypothetical protein ACKOVA_05285 [Novosphingobium sp.]